MYTMYRIETAPYYYEAQSEDGPYTAQGIVIEAIDLRGRVWTLNTMPVTWTRDQAERLVEKIQKVQEEDQNWKPSEHWSHTRDQYGSLAYQLEGGEEELRKFEYEAEFGPGTYQSRH